MRYRIYVNGDDLSHERQIKIITSGPTTAIYCVCGYEYEDFAELQKYFKKQSNFI